MDLLLKGRHALITAASEGLGWFAAQALVDEGCRATLCARDAARLDAAVRHLNGRAMASASGICCDLSGGDDLRRLGDAVLASGPPAPTILVVSTGHPPTDTFRNTSAADWDLGRRLLLDPVLTLCKTFLPGMVTAGFGRIIVVSSIFAVEHDEGSVIQSTYRRALLGLVKCIARDYACHGITANAISPGYFDTPLVQRHADLHAGRTGQNRDSVLDGWRRASPSHRFGTAREFGALVAYLSSPLSGFTSGANVVIDGAATRSL